ncbi:hypothetical protein KP509_09G038300 [Ceratopteris richardii]|uniref:Uncharacterized protein n=1 Tax=Ceratopteris richardii TaxID=49495 RepID=A0A8T2U3Y1_CERRI|nr:hypothetical protein KP509_09G038300 [Ceratopteris richardii]
MAKRNSFKLGLLSGTFSDDWEDLANSSSRRQLVETVVLGSVSVSILRWLASIAAIYLLILDRTNWRTNILTGLLVPYIFLNLPSIIFNIFRGEIGRWIAFVAIVLRLFFPRRFPDWLEVPAAMILLLVAAPSLLANYLRSSVIGYIISLLIGVYLLQEHIRAAGGFRKAFAEKHGISNTIGVDLFFLFLYAPLLPSSC